MKNGTVVFCRQHFRGATLISGRHSQPLPAIILVIALAAVTAAPAISLRVSLQELTGLSDLIAILEIVEVPKQRPPELTVDLSARAVQTITGSVRECAGQIAIREPVGLSTAVGYRANRRYLCFLKRLDKCRFETVGSVQGARPIKNGRVGLLGEEEVPLEKMIDAIRQSARLSPNDKNGKSPTKGESGEQGGA